MSGLMTITCPNRERKAILASSRHAGFIAQHCLYWNSHYWNPHLNSNQHLNTNIHTNSRHIGDQYPSKTSLNTQNTPVVRHTGITRKTIKTKICTIKASAVLHCCKNDQQFTLCPHSNCPTAPRPPNPKKVAIEARKVINAQSLLNCSVESNHEPWWQLQWWQWCTWTTFFYVSGMVVMVVRHILFMWKWCCHSSHLRTQRQKKTKLSG